MSLLLGSCERRRKRADRKYVIQNNTNHQLKMDVYQYDIFRYSREKIGSGILHEDMSSDDGMGKMISAYDALKSDSIVIYFNDNKRLIYYQANSFPVFRGIPNNNISRKGDGGRLGEVTGNQTQQIFE